MRIGIDGIPLAELKTGVGHYTFEIALELARQAPSDLFEILSHLPFSHAAVSDLNAPDNLTFIKQRVNQATRHRTPALHQARSNRPLSRHQLRHPHLGRVPNCPDGSRSLAAPVPGNTRGPSRQACPSPSACDVTSGNIDHYSDERSEVRSLRAPASSARQSSGRKRSTTT